MLGNESRSASRELLLEHDPNNRLCHGSPLLTLIAPDATSCPAAIDNDNTRRAYGRSLGSFFAFREDGGKERVQDIVKAPRQKLGKGKTPILTAEEAGELLRSIETETVVGLRDRALIGVMVFTFARVSAACGLNVADISHQQRRLWVRLHKKGRQVPRDALPSYPRGLHRRISRACPARRRRKGPPLPGH